MTFDASEKLRYLGQPVECFKFTKGATTWLWTSADQNITLPVGTFLKETISRGGFEFSGEDDAETIEISVTRTNPVAALFIPFLPSSEVGVSLYKAHRGSESEYVGFFAGKVVSARAGEAESILLCSSIKQQLKRVFPPLRFQGPCNHVLYSPGCGANPTTSYDTIVVGSVSGMTVVSNDFALRPNGWFNAGRLVVSATGETRSIGSHVGNTVKLIGAVPGLKSLDDCLAYWGCNHLESDCGPAKFNVLANFMGFSKIPSVNPARDGVE